LAHSARASARNTAKFLDKLTALPKATEKLSKKQKESQPKGQEAILNLPSPRRVVQGSPLLDVVVNMLLLAALFLGVRAWNPLQAHGFQ